MYADIGPGVTLHKCTRTKRDQKGYHNKGSYDGHVNLRGSLMCRREIRDRKKSLII